MHSAAFAYVQDKAENWGPLMANRIISGSGMSRFTYSAISGLVQSFKSRSRIGGEGRCEGRLGEPWCEKSWSGATGSAG